MKCVLYPSEFYIKYNSFINDIIPDKDTVKYKLSEIENIIISYMNNKYINERIDEKLIKVMENIDNNKLLNILKIIEEEVKKLEFNVNYKLWLDSFFSKLTIGG